MYGIWTLIFLLNTVCYNTWSRVLLIKSQSWLWWTMQVFFWLISEIHSLQVMILECASWLSKMMKQTEKAKKFPGNMLYKIKICLIFLIILQCVLSSTTRYIYLSCQTCIDLSFIIFRGFYWYLIEAIFDPLGVISFRLDGSFTDSGAELSDHELSTSYDILPDMGYGNFLCHISIDYRFNSIIALELNKQTQN